MSIKDAIRLLEALGSDLGDDTPVCFFQRIGEGFDLHYFSVLSSVAIPDGQGGEKLICAFLVEDTLSEVQLSWLEESKKH